MRLCTVLLILGFGILAMTGCGKKDAQTTGAPPATRKPASAVPATPSGVPDTAPPTATTPATTAAPAPGAPATAPDGTPLAPGSANKLQREPASPPPPPGVIVPQNSGNRSRNHLPPQQPH